MNFFRLSCWTSKSFQTALIVLGIFLRSRHYFENRSFWQDEICLALSIVNRSFQDIWQHVFLFPDFAQAPLIFQLIEKLVVSIGGNGEMSLRFFPFLVSIAAIFMAQRFFKRLLDPVAATLALAIFVIIDPLVYFAAELKPYGVEVFASLVVYEVFLSLRQSWSSRGVIALALIGAGIIWFSYTMLFVLAGCGIFLLSEEFFRGNRRKVKLLLGCYVFWILSFVFLYKVSLAKMLNQTLVGNWHLAGGFAPGAFFSMDGALWMGQAFLNMFRSPLGLDMPLLMCGFFLVGCYVLVKRDRVLSGFLLAPLVLTMAAAAFEKYPFFERLLLFLVPPLLVILALGIRNVAQKLQRYGVWTVVVLIGIVFWTPLQVAAHHVVVARGQEQNREIMDYLAAHFQPGDQVIVSNQAQYPFWYYGQKSGLIKRLQLVPAPDGKVAAWMPQLFPDIIRQNGQELIAMRRALCVYNPAGYFEKMLLINGGSDTVFIPAAQPEFLRGQGRAWVFLSHHNTPEFPVFIDKVFSRAGRRIDGVVRPGAALFLYDLSSAIKVK